VKDSLIRNLKKGNKMDKKKDLAKELLKKTIAENAYSRKIINQYKFLKAWDAGEISGIECVTGIEDEAKIVRIENDLMNQGKK
jgi:hypothetical protein